MENTNNSNSKKTLTKEELETALQDVRDGLFCTKNPIDDHFMLADIETRMVVFDNMLLGIKEDAKHNIISEDTLITACIFWNKMQDTITDALALLEYLYNAKTHGNVTLDDLSKKTLPDRIKEFQKKHGRR